jgi:argininosuccinate lyase
MAKKLWGGRFTKEPDKDFFEFQKSIHYDYKLAKYDVLHSMIHVLALGYAKILTPVEKNKLFNALKAIQEEIRKGKFVIDKDSEDIHTDIQNKVEKRVGDLALKLHTLRSRNDQIAFDEKCYCCEEGIGIEKLLNGLLEAIGYLQKKYAGMDIVGYTHTQRAQKISFKDYLDAYSSMFERDKKMICNFWKNLDIHIGAGALAGSSIKSHYNQAIKELLKNKDFSVSVSIDTVDDVSSRDFIMELLSILAILQMHLSRLAEDFILYSTKEFNYIKLPEEFCTGSSLMPQKKNPDFLEIVRGYTGKIYGNLISILTTMKGLPLTYNRDMQADKEPLFSSVEIVKDEVKIMSRFLKGVELNKKGINEALKDKGLYATQRADELVRKKGLSFKEAHDIIGREIRSQEKV